MTCGARLIERETGESYRFSMSKTILTRGFVQGDLNTFLEVCILLHVLLWPISGNKNHQLH
jgi:hypothetical protein